MRHTYKNQRGAAVIMSVICFLILSGVLVAGVAVPTANQIKSASEAAKARQSYIAADSANDDALYRLNQGWTLPASFSLPFTGGVTSVATVSTNADGATEISVVGDAGTPSRASKSVVSNGGGVSLNYSAQIGTGGIEISSGTINGNVYSNGNIIMISPSAVITGSATVANDSYPSLNQVNSSATLTDLEFGRTSALQDVAQGFQVTTNEAVSFLRVYLKKTGSPGDITLRIVTNSGSNPGGTTLATKTISASSVTNSFAYVVVPLTTPITLTQGTQYWIVLDYGSSHNSRYYTTRVSDGTYSSGTAKRGAWNSSTGGTWNSVTPLAGDMVFELYAGGTTNKIEGQGQWNRIRIGTGTTGTAWAYEVNNADVAGNAYCQNSTYLYALSGGAVKNCISQASAPVLEYPISAGNINEWKAVVTDAIAAIEDINNPTVHEGDWTIGSTGWTTGTPTRVNGNLTINGGTSEFGDLYVTGNLSVTGGATFEADTVYVGGSANFSSGNNTVDDVEIVGSMTVSGGSTLVADVVSVGGNANFQSGTNTVGATKVAGTTNITGGSTLNTKGTYWSIGNIIQSGGSHIKLHSSMGTEDGLIISDGRIDTDGGGDFAGSGTSGSYIIVISLSDCPGNCGGALYAINLTGGSGAVAVFAPYGTVRISGGSELKQVTAEKLLLQGNSSVTYEPGLADIDFEEGPSSGWVVESWDEVGQ